MIPGGGRFLVVGVTGGLSSGKSALCRMLGERGAVLIDADAVSREVTGAASPVLSDLVDRFGADILRPSGELDRKALGKLAFSSPEAVRDLNKLTHPAILGAIRDKLEGMAESGYDGIVLVEAALIVEEAASRELFDAIVAVVCADSTRLSRLSRLPKGKAAELLERTRSQLPDGQKAGGADYVVHNDGDLKELEFKADELWRKLVGKKASAGRGDAKHTE